MPLKHIAAALALTAFAWTPVQAQDANKDLAVVETAVEAAKTAGLAETITSSDGITVFVPSNEALTDVPSDALQGLLSDAEKLKSVIQYHALPGKVMAADVMEKAKDGPVEMETLGGGKVTLAVADGKVLVEGAMGKGVVIMSDVTVGNAVIHVIEGAMLPEGAM